MKLIHSILLVTNMAVSTFSLSLPQLLSLYVVSAFFVSSFLPLYVKACRSQRLCDGFNPHCGLTSKQAQRALLTPYEEILPKLRKIRRRIPWAMAVGPLVRSESVDGLLNIDQPLKPAHPNVNISVCPGTASPTIRQAVICTIFNDPFNPSRGNTNASRIGYSTQGRPLLAVRLGNPRLKRLKVMVVTQQHGNEPAATEAVFKFLDLVSRRRRLRKRLLRRLTLLFVVRANPDGGEPLAENNPPQAPFTGSQGFFRHNVDPSAGGGFQDDTEPGFFGVVGRGYDINRYHHVKLDAPIRPVETQAVVAALHSFRPHVVLDLHGDVPKTACEVDSSSVAPRAVIGALPSALCQPPAVGVPTVHTDLENTVIGSFFADDSLRSRDNRSMPSRSSLTTGEIMLRNIVTQIISTLQPRLTGTLTRFVQVVFESTKGTGPTKMIKLGLHQTPPDIGIVASGWEVLTWGTAVRTAVNSIKIVNGTAVPRIALDVPEIEPCWLSTNICLNEVFLRAMLMLMSVREYLPNENGKFCELPVSTGGVFSAPASLGWGAVSLENATVVPFGAQFGTPVFGSGTCPIDYSS